jgi:hypothetical protein
VTAATETVWAGYWIELLDEYGEGTFREALFRHCKREQFLPSPADLDRLCKEIKQERVEMKQAIWKKCAACNSDGWIVVQGPNGNYAQRCDCFRRWKADIQKAGL